MNRTSASENPAAADRLRELIHDIRVAMVTTVTPDGALRSRPMMTQDVTQPGEIWFLTADDSEKAHDLAEEQAVNASYADPQHGRYVSITGRGTISHNHEKLHELWDDAFTEFFPKGLDDPHLALLRVQIETAEFWDSHTGRMQSLHDESPSDSARGQGEPDKHAADNTEHTQIDIRATRASG